MTRTISLDKVQPNPDQPRKHFDKAKIDELAASIKKHGLIQAITVRRHGKTYRIVQGERRYRAHLAAGLKTIRAEIVTIDDRDADELTIVENLQRVDITPIEEAHAYQRMMDEHGYSPVELAARLGLKQPWRITERTALLNLRQEYQGLLKSKQLTPSQATELSKLGERGQDTLFQAIRRGDCKTYDTLRIASTAVAEAESQVSMFEPDEAPAVDRADLETASRFERKIDQVVALLNDGIRDNEITAVQKVNPTRAATLADQIAGMQKSLKAIEVALRQATITMDFQQGGKVA